jgi:hypothetical protein
MIGVEFYKFNLIDKPLIEMKYSGEIVSIDNLLNIE